MKTKPEAEQMPEEQAAELAALEAAAGPVATGDIQPGAEPEAGRADLATELRALVLMFVGMAGPILPSLPKIYTEETAGAAAQAVAAVCNKHGWLQGGLMGDYGEEIAAAAVLAPLAVATWRGVSADLAAMKPKTKKAIDAGPVATVAEGGEVNQKTVVFGAPIPADEGSQA